MPTVRMMAHPTAAIIGRLEATLMVVLLTGDGSGAARGGLFDQLIEGTDLQALGRAARDAERVRIRVVAELALVQHGRDQVILAQLPIHQEGLAANHLQPILVIGIPVSLPAGCLAAVAPDAIIQVKQQGYPASIDTLHHISPLPGSILQRNERMAVAP